MVHTLAQDFAAEVAQLCAVQVSGPQWRRLLDRHVPRVDPETSRLLTGRALTLADAKRDTRDTLYRSGRAVAERSQEWPVARVRQMAGAHGDRPFARGQGFGKAA